jgi:hypothetical protein
MTSLENRIPAVTQLDHVEGIVSSGGSFSLRLSRGQGTGVNQRFRLAPPSAGGVAAAFPDARIVYTSSEDGSEGGAPLDLGRG